MHGRHENVYKILAGKPEWRNHAEELNVGGNTKNIVMEIGWEVVEGIILSQDRDQW
jgi:hypothetical protein